MVHTPEHKSKSSSLRKPGDPPVRRRPVTNRSSRKPKLTPKSKIMTAKTEAGIRKAKRTQKEVTNAPVEFSGVKRMPNRSMADAGIEGTKAIKKILKGPEKRVKTSVTPRTDRKTPKRKSMSEAGKEGTAAFGAMLSKIFGAGRQTGKGSLDSFAQKVKAAKGYRMTGMDDADMKGAKKSTASPTASYAPKGRSNTYEGKKLISDATTTKEGRKAVRADRKLESMQKAPPLSKTQEDVATARKAVKVPSIPQGKEVKVSEPNIQTKSNPSYRGGQRERPKATPPLNTKVGPKGNTGMVGKFEDKIGSFMSNVFGSYSAASGVEGTDSYTTKKYKKGKRVN